MNISDLDAIVFDLGNVLVEIDFERAFAHWASAAGLPVATVRARWTTFVGAHSAPPSLADHERGQISDAAFFAALDSHLGTAIGTPAIAAGWSDIFVDLVQPVVAQLPALAARLPLYVFSNTNAAHTPVWTARFGARLEPHFRRLFLSHEIGRRKPDPDSFAWLADELDLPAARLLFLDDSAANVAGAAAAGWQAVHVSSAAAGAQALTRLLAP